MTPTLKDYQDRIVVLTGERDKLQIHAITYDGAIQECEHWIKVLEAEEPDTEQPAETPTDDVRPS